MALHRERRTEARLGPLAAAGAVLHHAARDLVVAAGRSAKLNAQVAEFELAPGVDDALGGGDGEEPVQRDAVDADVGIEERARRLPDANADPADADAEDRRRDSGVDAEKLDHEAFGARRTGD